MTYLCSLLDLPGPSTLQSTYAFISDRFRAVRTDIEAQQLSDASARTSLGQQVCDRDMIKTSLKLHDHHHDGPHRTHSTFSPEGCSQALGLA